MESFLMFAVNLKYALSMEKISFLYKLGTIANINEIKALAIKSWSPFQQKLTKENWDKLYESLNSETTYSDLLDHSTCFVCMSPENRIIGMAFLVPSGNPTDIYDKDWSYIRFVSVDPDFSGLGIGRKLTTMCIDLAIKNGEKIIALHTSEFMDKARHIYESLGFEILKELDERLGKRYWLYKLALNRENLSNHLNNIYHEN